MELYPGGFGDPKLKLGHRFANTLALLLLFRLLADIPMLNVDEERLQHLLANNPFVGTVDLFAGGDVMKHFSIVAVGIFPYLLAMILVQLTAVVSSRLREMQKSESGKQKLERITQVVTIPIAFFFAWTFSHYLSQQVGLFPGRIHWFTAASFWPSLRVVCLVTLGSLISTAVSHFITRKGIGSGAEVVLVGGSSLILLKQLAHVIAAASGKLVAMEQLGWIVLGVLVVIVLSIYVMGSTRKIPIEYPKRVVGRRVLSGSQSFLPLRLNSGRIFPVSAAIGLLALLQLCQGFWQSQPHSWIRTLSLSATRWTTPASGWYWIVLAMLIACFAYMYNSSVLWQNDMPIADNLRKCGGYVPGLRPGARTQDYISQVVHRISFPGGLGLALLAAGIPYAVLRLTHQNLMITILSLIIIVITVQALRDQACAYHLAQSYEGFLHPAKKTRFRIWLVSLICDSDTR